MDNQSCECRIFGHKNKKLSDFSGKVVIVTGSSSGLGEGIATLFAKLGANVVVTGRNQDNVKRVAKMCHSVSPKKLKALEVVGDITVERDAKHLIESTVKEFKKIDILVNNAGASFMSGFEDHNYMELFDKTILIDLTSMVQLTHLALPYLEKTKGNVVNISSGAAVKAVPQCSAYCVAKNCVDMFTRCLAVELGAKGIRVNSIDPGFVPTQLLTREGSDTQKQTAMAEWAKSISPLGKIGRTEEIAYSVVFIASDEASFTTGVNMPVDGGSTVA